MKIKNISIIVFAAFFLTLLVSIGIAQDENQSSETSSAADASYLDNLPCSTGIYTKVEKLSEDGTEAAFYNRYFDPFTGDNFYIDKLDVFNRLDEGSVMKILLQHTWDTSHHLEFEWANPGHGRIWAFDNDFNHVHFPDGVHGGRRDLNFGAESGWIGRDTFSFNYTLHQSGEAGMEEENPMLEESKTRDVDLKYDFDLFNWDNTFKVRVRNLDFNGSDLGDTRNLNFTLLSDREIGDSSFLRGTLGYSVVDLDNNKDYSNLNAGAFARFANALDIPGMDITAKLGAQKNNSGPSRMFPLGSTIDMNVGARWDVNPKLKIKSSWDLRRINKSHPSRTAIEEFLDDPELVTPTVGEIVNSTLWTHRGNLGGRYKLTKNMDFSAAWTIVKRQGMTNTEFEESGSPYLMWDSEMGHDYTLRYHPGDFHGFNCGDLEIKYTMKNRSNSRRNSSDDDNHFTINWTGMVNDTLWVHAGGGWLRTLNDGFELADLTQRGNEYGGGFQWSLDPRINLYGEYWKYNVSGADGFDDSSLCIGVEYITQKNFTIGLEYQTDNGEFDDITDLNYDAKLLLLKTTYNW